MPSLRLLAISAVVLAAQAPFGRADLVDAGKQVPGLNVELKYATTDNFLKRNVYGTLDRCYLHADAARMLAKAQQILTKEQPGFRLHVYDCARPRSVQLAMWEVVKGTPQAAYVANPHTRTGSIHNYGGAVDLTVDGADGKPLDMGTPYDHFGPEAHIDDEPGLVARGKLTKPHLWHRRLLRRAMTGAGFLTMREEWWHFNSATPAETRARHRIIP